MKYFLHDTNSFNDEKVTELFLNFGYEGLGLFYTTLEKLAFQEKPIKTNVLKAQLRIGKKLEKCWLFMEEIELIYSNNGETFNEQLLNFSEKYKIKKEKNKEKISQWRENQQNKKNVTSYEPESNSGKVKESKVNINNIEERKLKFADTLKIYLEKYGKDVLNDFYRYWTEPNQSNTKFRKELEKTWDLERRLDTWIKNDFKNKNNGHKTDNTSGKSKDRISTDFSNFGK